MDRNEIEIRIKKGLKVGKNSKLIGFIENVHPEWVTIGSNVVLGKDSRIITHGPIRPYKKNPHIIIEDLVWIGFRCIILPNIKIGKCSIIGAGSVVTKNIPPYHIAAGNPAKIIRKRSIDEIKRFYIIRWKMGRTIGSIIDYDINLLTKDDENYLFGVNYEEYNK